MNDSPLPALKSLRARGVIATLALLLYVALAGFYVSGERKRVNDSVVSMAELSKHERALAVTETAVSSALLDVNEAGSAATGELRDAPEELRLYMESCAKLFAELGVFDPGYARLERAIGRSYDALVASPVRAHWIDLREALSRAASELEIRRKQLADQRDSLTTTYQRSYDAVTVEAMLLSVIGLAAFGTLAAWFFNNLARDIGRLEAHARQIVSGSRSSVLDVQRDDELGRLMRSVNHMAVELDERERRIELDGERRSHHDKMLAVAALAAGVAHEVNNPLAIISGTAEAMREAARERGDARLSAEAERIVEQTRRASQATRMLADAATPQPTAMDWFDTEALVRRVLQWMNYDRRWRGFLFDVHVEPGLPAVRSSADAVQQVVMQMLTLACAAVGERPEGRRAVAIALALAESAPSIEVFIDFDARLDFSREEVQRTVMLARATLSPLGAQLAFAQNRGGQGHIKLILPINGEG